MKKRQQVGALFPNADTAAGFYSPSNFCITLNQITDRQLSEMWKDKDGFIDKRKLLHHEVRHHMDHLSTLWGHQRILALQEAVDARLDKDEAKFSKIAAYKIIENQTHYYRYYTVNGGTSVYTTPADRWIYTVSSGTRFNARGEVEPDKPILFISFASPDGKARMRVPITIASLLEINAMYEETVLEGEVIGRVDKDVKLKTKAGFVNKLVRDVIYNQDMTEYNCGVHLLANHFRITDPHEAYAVASSVATVALNLPREIIGNIPVNSKDFDVWKERPSHFINDFNYGFLFFNMLFNYKEHYRATGAFDLAAFLAVNQLPDQAALEELVIANMEANIASIKEGSYFCDFFKHQMAAGITLFKRRGIDGKREPLRQTFFSGQYIPFILTSNGAIPVKYSFDDIYNAADIPTEIDIMDWYHLSAEVSEKMEEFYRVCGI